MNNSACIHTRSLNSAQNVNINNDGGESGISKFAKKQNLDVKKLRTIEIEIKEVATTSIIKQNNIKMLHRSTKIFFYG